MMRIRHIQLTALLGLVLFLAFSSCKKGENDPAFTLLSRRVRVSGDWKMVEGSSTIGIKDSSGAHGSLVYKFNESDCDSILTYKSVKTNIKYGFTMSFNQKGEVSLKQTIGSVTLEASGTWDFLGAQGDYNNKERMTIHLTSITGYLNRLDFFNKGSSQFTYRIKELRGNKMVLVTEQELVAVDHTGYSIYVTSEYIFE